MITSRKVAGRHFEYVCSKCHKKIDTKYVFDSKCHHCEEKMSAGEGDSAVCLGKIIYGCLANCIHSRSHSGRVRDCKPFYCKAIGHVVSCVHDGGPYKVKGITVYDNYLFRLASG